MFGDTYIAIVKVYSKDSGSGGIDWVNRYIMSVVSVFSVGFFNLSPTSVKNAHNKTYETQWFVNNTLCDIQLRIPFFHMISFMARWILALSVSR